MIKPIKPIPIGPILLIGCGVILIVVVVIWQILLMQPNITRPRPQSGPAPTLSIPHTSTENLARAYFPEKVFALNGLDYSIEYLDFSPTRL
jgi:hypothetical protein